MLGLKEIAAAFRGSFSASEITLDRGDCPHEVLEMIVLLENKFGRVLTEESFNHHHRAIFSEVNSFCSRYPDLRKVWAEHKKRVTVGFANPAPPPPAPPAEKAPPSPTAGDDGGIHPTTDSFQNDSVVSI